MHKAWVCSWRDVVGPRGPLGGLSPQGHAWGSQPQIFRLRRGNAQGFPRNSDGLSPVKMLQNGDNYYYLLGWLTPSTPGLVEGWEASCRPSPAEATVFLAGQYWGGLTPTGTAAPVSML